MDHPCHVGADPGNWLAEADVVVVLDSLALWHHDKIQPRPEATVVNIGPDPLFQRHPDKMFRSNLALTGESSVTTPALIAAMDGLPRPVSVELRRDRLAQAAKARLESEVEAAKAPAAPGNSKAWVCHCLG